MPSGNLPKNASDQDLEYQAAEDVRTLVRAKEVRKDKKRLGRARAWAQKQVDALKGAKA